MLYPSGNLPGAVIPDNNTTGTGDSLTYIFSQVDSIITDLALTFALQGGYSGDLSGYLRLGNAVNSPIYNLTTLIRASSLSGGSPTTYSIDFNTATYGSGFQSAFNGQNPNNTWTLFFADTRAGDQTTLNGWSLNITAVPEPVNVALGVFGGLFAAAGLVRIVRRMKAA